MISYPASAFGSFILAVCLCIILTLFLGIWKGGAINILAMTYTGAAILFGIVIGLIMAWIFRTGRIACQTTRR